MINDNYEKEFEDEVYEDDYYDENYDEEELEDDSEYEEEEEVVRADSADDEEDDDYENEKRINVSFACDDCDYRWDDVIIKKRGNLEDEEEEFDAVCPMCGSINLTQI